MEHLPTLISDLAVILLAAGIITLIFKWIKQPVVLGYILAGVIAGPHLNLFHVTDMENIRVWADIGVIFLLFSLGLDFSFKKLFNIGGTAFITAITIVIGMSTLGYLTGVVLGWSQMNSLFLGGMLSMSSTTIIIKSFDDMGIRNQLFAGLVIGVLIVEDLVAVILMVLLSTISTSTQFSGMELMINVLRLVMFIIIWFVTGIFLLPTFLRKTKKWLNDETMLVIALALCLGMVLLATKIGFSAALGAFVMGSLLAETLDAERIEALIKPVKDFFGAIFFVSVGMMIDPIGLGQYWLPIVLIITVVIVGQITFGSIGMILSGQPLKVAIQSGFSLPQVGEFAFIIASLGLTLGVTNKELYPIIVAVSVVTTFFTPFFIKSADKAHKIVSRKLPENWLSSIHKLSSSTPHMNKDNFWSDLLKDLARIIGIYLAITATIIFFGFYYLHPALLKMNVKWLADLLTALIIIIAISPFLRAIMVKKNHTVRNMLNEQNISKGPLIALMSVRIIICISIVMFVIGKLYNVGWMFIFMIALSIIAFTIFSNWLKKGSIEIEHRFLSNLTERQQHAERQKPMRKEYVHHLMSRDIHLADFEIHHSYKHIGKMLKEIELRQDYGVNIVSIIRGERRINIPDGEERIYPHDKIVVVGTDQQLMKFSYTLEEIDKEENIIEKIDVHLEQIILEEGSKLIGKNTLNSQLRDKYRCMVVGIERNRKAKMNPDITETFKLHDIIWVVGEKQKILELVIDHK